MSSPDDTLPANNAIDDRVPPHLRHLNGRYRLLRKIGQGASGDVYYGEDEQTGNPVAVKVIRHDPDSDPARRQREVSALSVLRIPGVVQLIEEVATDDALCLVMEYIEGTRFPGLEGQRTWPEIEAVTLKLLDTLQQIHSQGIVHRDLKPDNIRVTPDGQPIILDFGLARGDGLGSTITRSHDLLGTPRYLSPEQIRNQRVDARTDLYSLGVMLFEILTGAPPHEAGNVFGLFNKKLNEDADSLKSKVPSAPDNVCHLVDRLLQKRREDRPQSAAEVSQNLKGTTSRAVFPWLGPTTLLDELTTIASQGGSASITGPVGSGKTRVLQELSLRIEATGGQVCWIGAGEQPFSSLIELLGPPQRVTSDIQTMIEGFTASLHKALASGLVLLADDAEHIDRWSADILATSQDKGAIFQTTTKPLEGSRKLTNLSETQLRSLFAGPDRLLHLREDGAKELFGRTQGLPRQIVAEVNAWLGAGLAKWNDEGLLAVTRADLFKLHNKLSMAVPYNAGDLIESLNNSMRDLLGWIVMAWPHSTTGLLQEVTGYQPWMLAMELAQLEKLGAVIRQGDDLFRPLVPAEILQEWSLDRRMEAHRRLVDLVPKGTIECFEHALGTQDPALVIEESNQCVQALYQEGHSTRAMEIAVQGLGAASTFNNAYDLGPLHTSLVKTALAQEDPIAQQQALVLLSNQTQPISKDLLFLLEASLRVWKPQINQVDEALSSSMTYDDPELEGWRQQIRVQASHQRGLTDLELLLNDLEPWSKKMPGHIRGKYSGWIGLLKYKKEEYRAAAVYHQDAYNLKLDLGGKLSSLVNLALAMIETHQLKDARAVGGNILNESSLRRLPRFSIFAEWIIRTADYRLGVAKKADLDLVQAAHSTEFTTQSAAISFNEAAISWRNNNPRSALELATTAQQKWMKMNRPLLSGFAQSLIFMIQGAELEQCKEIIAKCTTDSFMHTIKCQIIGMLARAVSHPPLRWQELAVLLTQNTPQRKWHHRLDVLSINEVYDSWHQRKH